VAWRLISPGELCDHYSFPPGLFKGFLLDAVFSSKALFRIAVGVEFARGGGDDRQVRRKNTGLREMKPQFSRHLNIA